MKYEFHVGDYVEDITGRIGYIHSFCNCKDCRERGFYEPYIIYNNGDCDYLTAYEYEQGFPNHKRIGQYDFTKKDDNKIEPLTCEIASDYSNEKLRKKINELVEAVNLLKKKVNKITQS